MSPAYRIYTPAPEVNSRYLHHLLRSRPYLEQYRQLVRGVTTFDRAVTKEDFADLPVLLPPFEEQRRIADFLDAETFRIDHLSTIMEHQDTLLGQLRLNVLDETWHSASDACPSSFARLGYLSNLVTSGSRGWGDYASDTGAFFFRSANLHSDRIQPKLTNLVRVQVPKTAAAEARRSRIEVGDVLIGITGANAGWVCLANDQVAAGHVSQHVCLIRPDNNRISGEWLALFIASPSTQNKLMGSQYGGTKTQLSLPDVREIRVPILSLGEQERVAEAVTRKIDRIDKQRMLRRHQIALLAERRQALITAAVTGQFDVSTASARNVTDGVST
ncbi:restriction endonuclease subunit S [Streptomyces sp. NPDC058463]|uniref:restriction endonuclease subunit S n=1 Tax=Streptomyces sp. NPDC058463 TaxID=3346510 RepID=UPI00365B8D5B